MPISSFYYKAPFLDSVTRIFNCENYMGRHSFKVSMYSLAWLDRILFCKTIKMKLPFIYWLSFTKLQCLARMWHNKKKSYSIGVCYVNVIPKSKNESYWKICIFFSQCYIVLIISVLNSFKNEYFMIQETRNSINFSGIFCSQQYWDIIDSLLNQIKKCFGNDSLDSYCRTTCSTTLNLRFF